MAQVLLVQLIETKILFLLPVTVLCAPISKYQQQGSLFVIVVFTLVGFQFPTSSSLFETPRFPNYWHAHNIQQSSELPTSFTQ